MNRLLAGAIAGTLATAPMTAVMVAGRKLLPGDPGPYPPEHIAHRIGEAVASPPDATTRRAIAWPMHFGFGALMGSGYTLGVERLPLPRLVAGVGWGLLVWLGSYQGWLPLVTLHPPISQQPENRNALIAGAHVVWGAALGTLAGRLLSDRRGGQSAR